MTPPPARRRWTFSLATLLMVMLACSVLSALLAGLMRAKDGNQYGYVLASVAAPVVILMVLSVGLQLRQYFRRYRRK